MCEFVICVKVDFSADFALSIIGFLNRKAYFVPQKKRKIERTERKMKKKMHFFSKNLFNSKKCSTFAPQSR